MGIQQTIFMSKNLEMCLWKEMELNKDSTTFKDVRGKYSHPLYKCVECDGYDKDCSEYKYMSEEFKMYLRGK